MSDPEISRSTEVKLDHPAQISTRKLVGAALQSTEPQPADPRRAQEAIESDLQIIQGVKTAIDNGGLEVKDWGQMKAVFYLPLLNVEDKNLILKELGANRVMKYFKAISGSSTPYQFPLDLENSDLQKYLDYEFSQASAHFVINLLHNRPLSKAEINILLCHCIRFPSFALSVIEEFDKGSLSDQSSLDSFLAELIGQQPFLAVLLGKIFGEERMSLLKELDQYGRDTVPFELIERLHELEFQLFGKTPPN